MAVLLSHIETGSTSRRAGRVDAQAGIRMMSPFGQ